MHEDGYDWKRKDYLEELTKDELAAFQEYTNLTRMRLLRHPNCQDPEHPGCSECRDESADAPYGDNE